MTTLIKNTELFSVLQPVLDIFNPLADVEFYVPEMVGHDQAYIMETYSKDEESVSIFIDHQIHKDLQALGFIYQYDSHYIKCITVNKQFVAIKVEYGVTFSINIFPCIILTDNSGEQDYVSLALNTQMFVTNTQLDIDNSIHSDPVKYIDQTLSLESFPEPALDVMFKALREYSKTLDIKMFVPDADRTINGVPELTLNRTHYERQQDRVEIHVVKSRTTK